MAKKSNAKKRRFVPPKDPTEAQLRAALADESEDIRAVDALIRLSARGGPKLTGLLADLATNSDDVDLRATAAHSLGQKASAKHREVLRSVVDDPEPEVARRAAESLGRVGGEVELKKLRSLRPADPVVKRAVETAKALLVYRTGAARGRLQVPQTKEILALGEAKTVDLEIRRVDPDEFPGLVDYLGKELPLLSLAPVAHSFDCGKAEYLLVWNEGLMRKKHNSAMGKSMIAGALLRRAQIDGSPYLDGHLLMHSSGGRVQLFLMRHSGEISHYGELTPGKKVAAFSVRAMNTRHAKPIELEGSIDFGTLEVTVRRGRVATQRSRVQPPPKKPRRLTTPR